MRGVRPTPENTNRRNYYVEVLDMAECMPYNYLVAFRHVSGFESDRGRFPCYYVGLLTPQEKLDAALNAVNDLFCEDDSRISNSDIHPEPMVPIPIDEREVERLPTWWEQKRIEKDEAMWVYVQYEWTNFPHDLTPTRFDAILEKWSSRWVW